MSQGIIIETHKNWVTRAYEHPNATQKVGTSMYNQAGKILTFLVDTKNGKEAPLIMTCTVAVGAGFGALVGLYIGAHRGYELVTASHANLALKIGEAILAYGLLPAGSGAVFGLIGAVAGVLTGVGVSLFVGTYATTYGAVGVAVRGTGDIVSAFSHAMRPQNKIKTVVLRDPPL